jgi:hypothetical protein
VFRHPSAFGELARAKTPLRRVADDERRDSATGQPPRGVRAAG